MRPFGYLARSLQKFNLRLLATTYESVCPGLKIIVEKKNVLFKHYFMGGEVASWFVRSTPERALLVRALAGDIVLCSRARHFALTAPTSTLVYKWVNTNLLLVDNPAMDKHPIRGNVEIFLVASCYGNRDKLWPNEPLCSYADLPYLTQTLV